MSEKFTKHPIFIFLAGLIAIGGCSGGLKKSEIAPDFTLQSLDGNMVNLSDAKDDVVLLSFWAVGCRPCRKESTFLSDLHKQYASRGLKIIAVNAWDDPASMIRKFTKERKIDYLILLDGAEVHTDLYQGRGIPNTYLIDRGGTIQYASSGWTESMGKNLTNRVVELLK